tara:strand:- start:6579 stop:6743 length:165 start_codon:yes stop_codon:yes gene_type:complete
MIDLVIYTDGCFRYDDLLSYTVPLVREIHEAINEKNEKTKEAMESSKGKNRRTF